MCNQAKKYSTYQVSKCINLIINHQIRITKFNTHTDSESTMSLDRTIPGKQDPSLPYMEHWWIGWFSTKPPKLYVKSNWLNSWRTAGWVAWGFCLLKVVDGAATWFDPAVVHRPAPGSTYSCHGSDPNDHSGENHYCWAPIGQLGSHIGTWKQKANTIIDPNIRKLVGGSILKTNTHLRKVNDITGISLRRHLGLRYCCSTVVMPTCEIQQFLLTKPINWYH